MPDVFFKLTAEERDVIQAHLKILDSQKKIEGGYRSMRKASEETDKAAAALGKGFEAAGKAVVDNVLPSLARMTTVVGGIGEAWKVVNDLMGAGERRVAGTVSETNKLYESLAKAGKISLFPEIEEQIKKIAAGSKTLTEPGARGLAAVLGPVSKNLNANQMTSAIRYAVKAADYGLDATESGAMLAQLSGFNPDGAPGQNEHLAGQLMGLGKGGRLGDDEMLEIRRAMTGGLSFGDAIEDTMVGRKSGETGKKIERMNEEALKEITSEMTKPHLEVRAANEPRIEALKKENLQLKEQEDTEKRASSRKKLAKQQALNSHEIERLEADKVETLTLDQQRLVRLGRVPMDQRLAAVKSDPSLLPTELQRFANNATAARLDIRAKPPVDFLQNAVTQEAELPQAAGELVDAVKENLKATAQLEDLESGKAKTADIGEIQYSTWLKQKRISRTEKGGSLYASGLEMFNKFGIGPNQDEWDDMQRQRRFDAANVRAVQATKEQNARAATSNPFPSISGPVSVKLDEDNTRIDRVQPARNGGN